MSNWMRARPTRQTVPAVAVQVLIDALEAIGENGEEALTRSGLSLGHPIGETQQDDNVPRAAFARLFENCLRVFHHHNCRRDGFSPISTEAYRMMCLMMLACPNLRVAIETAGRFQDMLMGGSGRLALTVQHGVARLNLNDTARRTQLGDMVVAMHSMAACIRLFSWLIGQEIEILRIAVNVRSSTFQHAFNEWLQILPELDQPRESMEFPEAYLDRPITRRYDELPGLFMLFPFDVYATEEQPRSTVESVRIATQAALLRSEPIPDMAELARMFGLTVPTFRRRIAAEETSLGEIRRLCKQDLALRWLSEVNLTVKEIASRLQFSDVASFRRAFRSWTGQSPFGYRSDMASPAQPRLAGAWSSGQPISVPPP